MTDFQATMFQKFSTLVCVDSTHKTNEYGYKLISIVVADEFKNGVLSVHVYPFGLPSGNLRVTLFSHIHMAT